MNHMALERRNEIVKAMNIFKSLTESNVSYQIMRHRSTRPAFSANNVEHWFSSLKEIISIQGLRGKKKIHVMSTAVMK